MQGHEFQALSHFKPIDLKLRHNKYDRQTLEQRLKMESFERTTISFYRYCIIENPEALREVLYQKWYTMGCLGRIYLAREGINAQMSIPEHKYEEFLEDLDQYFPDMPIKKAIEEQKPSFLKLIIKVKKKIVADGLKYGAFDVTNVGKHLSAAQFNQAMEQQGTIIVDMRNAYESEVGYFQGALKPDVDSFSDELPVVKDMLKGKEENKILLYCTGGIRCEKTSAWLKHHGFKDVNQLHGGIIDYVRQVKEESLECKFVGKNFVFDERLGERITPDVVAHCHICGVKADYQSNCRWQGCHTLFVSCLECSKKLDGCCTQECQSILGLPEEQKAILLKSPKAPLAAKRNLHKVAPQL